MYLNMRELDAVMTLWDKMRQKEKNMLPNQRMLDTVFECSLRLKNSDRMVEVLEEYVA